MGYSFHVIFDGVSFCYSCSWWTLPSVLAKLSTNQHLMHSWATCSWIFFWTAQGHIGWIGRHLQKWTQSCVIFQSHFVCFWFLFLLFFCFLLRLCNMRLNTDDDVKSYNSWCCKIQCTVVFFGLFFFHPLNDCLQSYKVLHALFKTARQNCIASNRRRSSHDNFGRLFLPL